MQNASGLSDPLGTTQRSEELRHSHIYPDILTGYQQIAATGRNSSGYMGHGNKCMELANWGKTSIRVLKTQKALVDLLGFGVV